MAQAPILYDLTRLASRFTRPTPNGIDRIDVLYGEHFLRTDRSGGAAGFMLSVPGPRPIPPGVGRDLIASINVRWREDHAAEDDGLYRALTAILADSAPFADAQSPGVHRLHSSGASDQAGGAWLRGGLRYLEAATRRQTISSDTIYLNVSQFPVWNRPYFRWLKRRGIRLVFMIHDVLPISHPEFFPKAEAARHRARLAQVAACASGIIVSSDHVADAVRASVQEGQHAAIPMLVAPFPVRPSKAAGATPFNPRNHPYFVVCSTMEPRKNHLLLLHIWRDLAARLGGDCPRLVIVGARGWNNENVLDLLTRCPSLRSCVIEVSGLSTPALDTLMRDASAVLMPTFAEGFGLPVHEALAAGARVIASDIPPFRALAGDPVHLLHPLDGPGWMQAILDHASTDAGAVPSTFGPSEAAYFESVETFLSAL